ncbi:MAG: hypothetical protein ACRENH_14520 [Gemmatimonadaceae bacterium]
MTTHTRISLRSGVALIALCALAPGLIAQRSHPAPTPILAVDWGIPADSLLKKAAAAGWQFIAIDEDGDYAFHAVVDGEEALVFATIGDNGLTKLLASFAPHREAEFTFRRLADTLTTYFGPAAISSDNEDVRPAPSMVMATAWNGIMMGLRRDRRILILFTCPASTPELPLNKRRAPIA